MDVDRLGSEEESAWRALHAAFDSIPSERLDEPGVTPDGWSSKDLMFHIGAWCGECGDQLERMRTGTYVDVAVDTDAKNREWFETSRRLDVPTVKTALDAARTRMLREWKALDETPSSAVEWFEESGRIHYVEHMRDLQAWRDRA